MEKLKCLTHIGIIIIVASPEIEIKMENSTIAPAAKKTKDKVNRGSKMNSKNQIFCFLRKIDFTSSSSGVSYKVMFLKVSFIKVLLRFI